MCRERGARLVVDGVQAAGILAAPLESLGADVVAIGGHKGLFGLTGSGIVYCREELVNELRTDWVKAPVQEATARAHDTSAGGVDILALHDALEELERLDAIQARIVELRYFTGLTIEETAEAIGVSPATVKREWAIARAWLRRELAPV